MGKVWIIGAGMTKFGKHPDRTVADLGTEAVLAAIADASLDPRRIEAAYCGHVFQGMVAGQRVLAQTGLAGIPLTNVEDACSSGAVAIREAALSIRAGEHDVVLAFGMEHLTSKFRGALTPAEDDLETAVGLTMPAIYAMRARAHMQEFRTTRRQIALISVKNKRHASLNPLAMFQNTVTAEEVMSSRPIADPLCLYDCSPVSDGAAAVILCSDRVRQRLTTRRAAQLTATALRSGEVESELSTMAVEPITQRTAKVAYEQAGVGPEEIDLAEVHDCFSIAEVLRVEALGLFPTGDYPARVERGEATIGGALPINPSGGLLGKGHPLGATGVAQVVELVRQLRGEAGQRQIAGAKIGLAHCRGGKAAGVEGAACTVNIVVA